ncbi:hypothetical protein EZL74_12995 [Flavobacterium silvisoli]|uniref:Sporadically distributed protein, TIGR04141 family n=1 Tax=Flavobacterium silvisoli TaxID=2529433 RepID=A0A4Q9YQ44_9FLAO|nr:DUF6119 family protein [Flavobacterium silvisoli]TBX64519.1 hypothetical protein EZL74_12995 [Flavobacterium silvisoli]
MKFNLKIFLIDKNNFLLKKKSNKEIIEFIRDNHKRGLHAQETDLNVAKPTLNNFTQNKFEFFTYCYNQPKDQNYWKLFLPSELAENQNFEIIEFSYVLFIIYKSNIYCTVGGSGFNVIQTFMDNNFGIDLYQHFAKPEEDIILKVGTRGVASNIAQKDNTFSYDQRISESLEYSEIPKKIKVIVRKELKKGIFKKYDLDNSKSIMEIGSYFSLRKKIDFEELKSLIKDIHKIRSDKTNYTQLTLFSRIDEQQLLQDLDNGLKEKIADDVILHNNPQELHKLREGIIEVINPKKLDKFFECNEFKVRFKKTWSKNDRIVKDKEDLYFECTEHIFKSVENILNRSEIIAKLFDLNIIGIVGNKESTFGNFYSHIVCERIHLGKKYFRVDGNWYYLDNKFLERVNKDAISTYSQNELSEDLLNSWQAGWNEDTYNNSHTKQNYFVLDKLLLKDNIELCDILIYQNKTLYFVHVKNGFTTQMRNLYIQVVLSAKRLNNDLFNNVGSSYFIKTLEKYNKKHNTNIDAQDLYEKILNDEIAIEFVMAYNNYSYPGKKPIDKIELSDSNIAKYSLVQTVREMRGFRRFGIKVIDISKI